MKVCTNPECTKAGQPLPLEDFYRRTDKRDGRQSRCRTCVKAYHAANRDKRHAYYKAYHKANRDKILAKSKAYHAANRDTLAAKSKERRADNRDAERDGKLRRTYGITLADWKRMYDEQDGRCKCCLRPFGTGRRLQPEVEHCHVVAQVFGKAESVRGLACGSCNSIAGHAGDDPERVLAVARYLLAHRDERYHAAAAALASRHQ